MVSQLSICIFKQYTSTVNSTDWMRNKDLHKFLHNLGERIRKTPQRSPNSPSLAFTANFCESISDLNIFSDSWLSRTLAQKMIKNFFRLNHKFFFDPDHLFYCYKITSALPQKVMKWLPMFVIQIHNYS